MSANTQSGKVLFPFIIVLFIGVIGYFYVANSTEEKRQRPAKATVVSTHTVQNGQYQVTIESVGSARANDAINILSAHSDYVESLYFDDGETVKAGQKLLQLRAKQEQLDVKELKINLKEEQRQLKRLQELAKTQSTAKSQLDTQRSKVSALIAQIEATQSKLEEMTVYAPFSGTLGQRQVSVGSFVTSNTVISTLDDISKVKVDFEVPEKYLSQLKQTMPVFSTSDAYQNQQFTGKVSHIDTRINMQTRSVKVTALFNNSAQQLRPGMLLYISLPITSLETLIVPEKSIIPRENKHFVYVVQDGKAMQTEVSISHRLAGKVAISAGLSAGQVIITEGALKIRHGSAVKAKG